MVGLKIRRRKACQFESGRGHQDSCGISSEQALTIALTHFRIERNHFRKTLLQRVVAPLAGTPGGPALVGDGSQLDSRYDSDMLKRFIHWLIAISVALHLFSCIFIGQNFVPTGMP